ncbi:MAG: hypothetical protein WDA42_07425 [Candidatus Bathyarchaeia archaeon]
MATRPEDEQKFYDNSLDILKSCRDRMLKLKNIKPQDQNNNTP